MTKTTQKWKIAIAALEAAEEIADRQFDRFSEISGENEIAMMRLAAITSALSAVSNAPLIIRKGNDNTAHKAFVMANHACRAAIFAIYKLADLHTGNDADTNPLKWLISDNGFHMERLSLDDLFSARTRDEVAHERTCVEPKWFSREEWLPSTEGY